MHEEPHAVPTHLYVPQSPAFAAHEPEPLHAPTCVTLESEPPSVHVSLPHFVTLPG
jgi:hypothetical protein